MIFTAKVAQSASVLLLMMLTDRSAKPFFFFLLSLCRHLLSASTQSDWNVVNHHFAEDIYILVPLRLQASKASLHHHPLRVIILNLNRNLREIHFKVEFIFFETYEVYIFNNLNVPSLVMSTLGAMIYCTHELFSASNYWASYQSPSQALSHLYSW